MSQRGKRGNRLENDQNAQQQQQPPSKRRKGRPPTGFIYDQEHELSAATTIPVVSAGVQPNLSSAATSSTLWQARSITDLKIYNRSSSEAPAELFRKDLISAMKLPDSEPLSTDEYWIITDQWKQEWERGVQVPVNPDSLPEPSVKQLQCPVAATRHDFKLPRNKYLRITKDDNFSAEQHFLSNAPALAETACSYDLDQVDEVWLKLLNNERALCGAPAISDGQFERVVEELEVRCWDKIQAIMRNEEGLGIEYDENVICDVCRSPDSEEANEMVFCDNCNICVHQACYGITVIPSGQWLCRTCSMGKKPDCTLCPNKGGAMKSTRSGKKWAHVSCALWIPEVSIGCVDRMEPITKISSIPQSRWSLICILCRERVGACIQCSVKSCKTAYHVTCAFQHGLEMRAIIEEGNAEDGVKLRSYCLKHCNAKGKKDKGTNNNGVGSGSDDDDCRRRKIRKDMTSEERNQVRLMRLKEVEAEFDKHVNIKDISCHLLDVDQEAISFIHNYWILKRKSSNNRPLIPPKADDVDMIPNRQDQADIEKKIMFVHLRQDLERVRNLCYMVNRREKLSRSFFKMREQIFYKQIAILSENSSKSYDESVISAIIHANNGSSVYDKCYSSSSSLSTAMNFDDIQEKIKGMQQFTDSSFENNSDDRVKKSSRLTYKKIHVNGISDRKTDSVYEDSCMSSNSDAEKFRLSADGQVVPIKKNTQSYSKILEKHKRRKSFASSIAIDSSSDDDNDDKGHIIVPKKNPSLHQMEKELAKDNEQLLTSSDDSDLLPIKHTNNALINKKSSMPIYSDSDSTDKEKTDNTVSDSQQQMIRTKAAMKEFTLQAGKHKQESSKKVSPTKSKLPSNIKHKSPEEAKTIEKRKSKVKPTTKPDSDTDDNVDNKEKSQKHKQADCEISKADNKASNSKRFPTDLLVVPQRQAAKKASENMKSTNSYVGVAGQKKEVRDAKSDEKYNDWVSPKGKEKPKDKELKEGEREKEKERDRDKEKDKERTKPRGRPPKSLKDEQKEKAERDNTHIDKKPEVNISPEIQKADKQPGYKKVDKSDNNMIVAYVPQRQAAKKAAEHIKSGMGKSTTSDSLLPDEKDKEQMKEKIDKGKGESERSKERPKDRGKVHPQDKESDIPRISEKEEKIKELQKTEKKVKEVECNNETEKEISKVEKKPSTMRMSFSSSESSSSSSCSSSSSAESDNENDDALTRKTDLLRKKSKTPERSPTKISNKFQHTVASKAKNASVSIAKSIDSDVCILDDSSEIPRKKKPSTKASNSATSDTPKEAEIRTDERNVSAGTDTSKKSTSTIEVKNRRNESSLENYINKSPAPKILLSPVKENVQTLEEEMAQRKADLSSFQLGGFKNKANKNTCSLDKLLNKKEKERRQAQECPEKPIETMDLDDSSKSTKDIEEKSESSEPKELNVLNDILRRSNQATGNISEIIDIDSESVESKSDQFEMENQRNEDDEEMKSLSRSLPVSILQPDQNYDNDSGKSEDMVIEEASPTHVEVKKKEISKQQSDEMLSGKSTCDFPIEPIFEAKINEEDSARETMDLVQKLRQKYKRSSSSSIKSDETINLGVSRDLDTKSNTSAFNFGSDIFPHDEKTIDKQTKEKSMIFEKDVPKTEMVSVKEPFEPPISESAINFFDKNQLLCDISRSIPVKESCIMDLGKGEKSILEPKSVEKVQQNVVKQSDSFDTLSQSNFFKNDFVDMQEKESLTINTNSSKLVECEYDENTRMQSPYANPANIWNENNLIQTRRSVSSSPSSISESNDEFKMKINSLPLDKSASEQQEQGQQQQHHQLSTISCDTQNAEKNNFNIVSTFGITPSQFQLQQHQQTHLQTSHSGLNGVEMMPYNYAGTNHYNGPVSLFPPQSVTNMSTQMPFPSPVTPIFPPALSGTMPLSQNAQSDTSIFGHMGKHNQSSETTYPLLRQSCAAAFTSSSDNLAITEALVANNVPSVPIASSQMVNNSFNLSAENIVSNNSDPNSLNHIVNCDIISNNNINMKGSPSKRTSARFNQIKSPSMQKSPGKSPRNMELLSRQQHHSQGNSQKFKFEASQRTKNKSSRGTSSSRARGRGRGRGNRLVVSSQIPTNLEFDNHLSSIHNNLAGTVYDLDFDEDLTPNVENLKSLRDSRRSFDCRTNTANTCDQKFTSPSYHGKLRNAIITKSVPDVKSPSIHTDSDMHTTHPLLHNIHPVLPGPVDMRTYSSGYENQTTSQEAYNNQLLGAFASGMADQTLNEIDEEVEKELQSALKASGTYKPKQQPISDIVLTESHVSIETTSEEISIDSDNTISKVSLSDSRHQLKLKIKGPLACPDNYNTQSSCVSLNQNHSSENLGLQINSASNVTLSSAINTTGTSSLRRMRKKELLRQYWTQDMNMGDATSLPAAENKINNDPILNRSVGIPKAVDSMSSIPTKEDYKDYAAMDPRKRKRLPGLSRELRQLDIPYDTERPERRRSVCSSGSNISVNNVGDPMKVSLKRRGKNKINSPNNAEPPKLKIKIGNNHIETITDGNRILGCPPKKRITTLPVPSLEILKRDCMNYRKQVMADFNEEDKVKKPKIKTKKNNKASHKKRKKEKRNDIQVIENSTDTPKLIIRFGKRKAQDDMQSAAGGDSSAEVAKEKQDELSENNGTAESFSMMPIKLKIARNSDGGGYVIGDSKHLDNDHTTQSTEATEVVHKKKPDDDPHSVQDASQSLSEIANSSALVTDPEASNSESSSKVNLISAHKVNNDLKGQSRTTKGCPLLPLNKDCEVR